MSDSGPQPSRLAMNSGDSSLQPSNTTSEHFLGRQPRAWESNVSTTNATTATSKTVRKKRGGKHNTITRLPRHDLNSSLESLGFEFAPLDTQATQIPTRNVSIDNINPNAYQENSQGDVSVPSHPLPPRPPPPSSSPSVLERINTNGPAIVTQLQRGEHGVPVSPSVQLPNNSNLEASRGSSSVASPISANGISSNPQAQVFSQNWDPSASNALSLGMPTVGPVTGPMLNDHRATQNIIYPNSLQQSNSSSVPHSQSNTSSNRGTVSSIAGPAESARRATQILPVDLTGPYLILPETRVKVCVDRVAKVMARKAINSLEAARIAWLREAAQLRDFSFCLLHQMSCIQTTRPNYLATHLAFQTCHIEGLRLIESILGLNARMDPELLEAFAHFFEPITSLSSDLTFQGLINHAKDFLQGFAYRYQNLRHDVFARGCPPCVREFHARLGLYQTQLSKIIFTDLLYQLFPSPTTEFVTQSVNLFKQSQAHMSQSISQGTFGTEQDISVDGEVQLFASKFSSLVQAYGANPAKTCRSLREYLGHDPMHPTSVRGANFPTYNVPRLMSGNPGRLPVGTQVSNQGFFVPNTPRGSATPNSQPGPSSQATNDRLFPSENQPVPISANPDPNRSALHQADLSLQTLNPNDNRDDQNDDLRFYSFLDFILGWPTLINNDTGFSSWLIKIPREVYQDRVSVTHSPKDDFFNEPKRTVSNKNIMVHLRCVASTNDGLHKNDRTYSALATSWPEHIFISINGSHLDFQRKAIHGRDLALDITHLLQEGSNEVQMSYHVAKKESGKSFTLTCEVIRILDHPSALEVVGVADFDTSLAAITLPSENDNTDEDVIMTDEHVSIDLIDPITAKVPDRPVRGKTCQHRECFDLEPFFLSRPRRYKDCLVYPDEWRCPICKGDARPTSLVVDQFLVHVKEKLMSQGKADTKAILVKKDGSWEPKAEVVGQAKSNVDKSRQRSTSTRNSSVHNEIKHRDHPTEKSNTFRETEPEIIILDD